jgi:hypothetical protein
MKRKLWQAVGFLAALLAASTAVGQTKRGDTIADIPFAFTVSNHTLPAGRYTVTRLSEKALRIFNSQNQGTFALTNKVEGKAPESGKRWFFTATEMPTFFMRCGSPAAGSGARFSSLDPRRSWPEDKPK